MTTTLPCILLFLLVSLPTRLAFAFHLPRSISSRRKGTHNHPLAVRSSLASTQPQPQPQPDVIVIGSGIGGLSASLHLIHSHSKRVLLLESHYLPGGCAHTFPAAKGYEFESGPTVMLGCTGDVLNPLSQVLNDAEVPVDWISYESWGVIGDGPEPWTVELGEGKFQSTALPLRSP